MTDMTPRFHLVPGPDDVRTLCRRAGRIAAVPGTRRSETWIALDSVTGALARAGLVLLMVRSGRDWYHRLVPVPPEDAVPGDSGAVEWPAPGACVLLSALPDRKLRQRVDRALGGAPVTEVAAATVVRQTWTLRDGASLILTRIAPRDRTQGKTPAPPRTVATVAAAAPADMGAALDVARTCVPLAGLLLGAPSPEVQLVRAPVPPAPVARMARAVALSPGQSTGAAATAVLREVTAHIRANVRAVLDGAGPEAAHQLRVGLRRLRSALGLFRDAAGSAETRRLGEEARWLAAEVGRLRDLDVIVDDVLLPEAAAHPGESGFARLADALRARGATERATLDKTLAGARTQDLLIDLVRLTEAAGGRGAPRPDRAGDPVAQVGADALDRRWRKVCRMAREIDTLDVEARHALRKELKKLRYGAEFLGAAFPARQVGEFVRRLKALQEIFGSLNDAATAEHMLTGPNAPGAGDPDMARAAGMIIGARRMRATQDWALARGLWSALKDERPFWR
jgi:CHAD domain-containing protein